MATADILIENARVLTMDPSGSTACRLMTMSPASGSPALAISTRISRSPESLTSRWMVPGVNQAKLPACSEVSRWPSPPSVITRPRPETTAYASVQAVWQWGVPPARPSTEVES